MLSLAGCACVALSHIRSSQGFPRRGFIAGCLTRVSSSFMLLSSRTAPIPTAAAGSAAVPVAERLGWPRAAVLIRGGDTYTPPRALSRQQRVVGRRVRGCVGSLSEQEGMRRAVVCSWCCFFSGALLSCTFPCPAPCIQSCIPLSDLPHPPGFIHPGVCCV